MGRKDVAHSFSTGTALVLAAAACAAGALLPTVFAAIVVGALIVAGITAFSIHRAEHVLDAIFKQELSARQEVRSKKSA
jgi:cytochrome bd-type quinol oxidase subunit 1